MGEGEETNIQEETIQYKDQEGNNIWNFFFGGEYDVGTQPENYRRAGCPEKPMTCKTGKTSAIYTHWGSQECNPQSTEVYRGYVGGGHFSHFGGINNPLCLPDAPEYNEELTTDGGGERSNLYGAEYQTNTYSPWSSSHDKDMICAVCLTKGRSTNLMIPAKRTCPEGWTKEYEGLLMGGHHSHAGGHESICVDINPEGRPGSMADLDGMLFFPVIGICGSLPCTPYIANRELACVVCTR
ncbi:uncharacterized protein [Antedon mediterranea]|uniref:uncharacterized protein n=1 Tax=Antedon mediterranea TaxID=105859 RepID=UPI003AF45D33